MIAVDEEEDRAALLKFKELEGVAVSGTESTGPTVHKGKIARIHPSLSDNSIRRPVKKEGLTEFGRVKCRDRNSLQLKMTDKMALTFTVIDIPQIVTVGFR